MHWLNAYLCFRLIGCSKKIASMLRTKIKCLSLLLFVALQTNLPAFGQPTSFPIHEWAKELNAKEDAEITDLIKISWGTLRHYDSATVYSCLKQLENSGESGPYLKAKLSFMKAADVSYRGGKNIPFVVPATALNGNTRMRLVMNFDFYRNNPCATPGEFYGEAEDYTVEITGGAFNGVPLNAVAENAIKANTLNSLVVAPNPVNTSSANLILQTVKEGAVNIRIADLSGRILRSENITRVIAGRNTYALHNLNLLPGTYMMVAVQVNAIIARTRFIVAK